MNEFQRAIDFLLTRGIEAHEEKLMINVPVSTPNQIGPMATKLKKLLDECGYEKSWRVYVPGEIIKIPSQSADE